MQPPFPDKSFNFVVDPPYLHINCGKCQREAIVEYKGLDPTMPQIRLRCDHCGIDQTLKIFNPQKEGFHPDPY